MEAQSKTEAESEDELRPYRILKHGNVRFTLLKEIQSIIFDVQGQSQRNLCKIIRNSCKFSDLNVIIEFSEKPSVNRIRRSISAAKKQETILAKNLILRFPVTNTNYFTKILFLFEQKNLYKAGSEFEKVLIDPILRNDPSTNYFLISELKLTFINNTQIKILFNKLTCLADICIDASSSESEGFKVLDERTKQPFFKNLTQSLSQKLPFYAPSSVIEAIPFLLQSTNLIIYYDHQNVISNSPNVLHESDELSIAVLNDLKIFFSENPQQSLSSIQYTKRSVASNSVLDETETHSRDSQLDEAFNGLFEFRKILSKKQSCDLKEIVISNEFESTKLQSSTLSSTIFKAVRPQFHVEHPIDEIELQVNYLVKRSIDLTDWVLRCRNPHSIRKIYVHINEFKHFHVVPILELIELSEKLKGLEVLNIDIRSMKFHFWMNRLESRMGLHFQVDLQVIELVNQIQIRSNPLNVLEVRFQSNNIAMTRNVFRLTRQFFERLPKSIGIRLNLFFSDIDQGIDLFENEEILSEFAFLEIKIRVRHLGKRLFNDQRVLQAITKLEVDDRLQLPYYSLARFPHLLRISSNNQSYTCYERLLLDNLFRQKRIALYLLRKRLALFDRTEILVEILTTFFSFSLQSIK